MHLAGGLHFAVDSLGGVDNNVVKNSDEKLGDGHEDISPKPTLEHNREVFPVHHLGMGWSDNIIGAKKDVLMGG